MHQWGETEAPIGLVLEQVCYIRAYIWKSKHPYNSAYYDTNSDEAQVKSCWLKHNGYPQARPDITQSIAHKTVASPVCQHWHYKGVPLILVGGQH